MQLHPAPFLVVNPKSYLYGEGSLALAKSSDAVAKQTGLTIYFTCPFSDIRLIRENTDTIIVTAQAMESLPPGRGMGPTCSPRHSMRQGLGQPSSTMRSIP